MGYALAWLGLSGISRPLLDLPAGLRFGALLLAPKRLWPWLIAAEWSAVVLLHMTNLHPAGGISAMLSMLPQPLVAGLLLLLLQRHAPPDATGRPERTARLLLAALVVAVGVSLLNAALTFPVVPLDSGAFLQALARLTLGNFGGIVLVSPLLAVLLSGWPDAARVQALMHDLVLVLLPATTLLLLLLTGHFPLARYALGLSLVVALFFAFRHGWRGASLALSIASLPISLLSAPAAHASATEGQLFLAIAGTSALLLGSSTDALRQTCVSLAVQNARLANVTQRLDQLARQLEGAARRNLQEEEGERKRIAAELHDELGQNLTAIQIRVKIAQTRLESAGLGDVAASINDIVATMRRSVRGLLESLRPAALNEFGLTSALTEGPLRELIRSAGMDYCVAIHGNPRSLDEAMRVTIYRIVQEAATNCVRHARARQFGVRLRVGRRHDECLILLDVRDDGVGLVGSAESPLALGRGLTGMRERVLALGGTFRMTQGSQGLRLRILIRQPHSTA